MDIKRTALTAAVALFLVTFVHGQATTQADIDNIADNLEVKVILKTQHFPTGQHGVQISLKNLGTSQMLQTQDWIIQFSLKNQLFQGTEIYASYGLEVKPVNRCSYLIKPDPTSVPPFQGLNSQEYVAFTIPSTGMSAFKTDVYPNFVISTSAGDLTARTINSTTSEDLDFVYIHRTNVSMSDPSLMNGIRRSITTADIMDQNGVPTQTVVPAPMSVDLAQPLTLLFLNESTVWYIWAGNQISTLYKNQIKDSMESLPSMAGKVQIFVPSRSARRPPTGASIVYIVKEKTRKKEHTKDYYKLAVGNNGSPFIHITAYEDEGFANALASLESVYGLFVVLPHITIEDDARFSVRSVYLDVTKNFFPASDILKFLELMRMYKLNNLVLNLADDYAWRIEMPGAMDFEELTSFASQRCMDSNECLDPLFGSGASNDTSGSGFYSTEDFLLILREASKKMIRITPKINFMGGMHAAKAAAHKRYMRLKTTDRKEADRLHIMSHKNYPTISDADVSPDTCYKDGLLDPCSKATSNFMKEVVAMFGKIYRRAGVNLEEFHAGGDEMTKHLHKFACTDPLRSMLNELMKHLTKQTRVRVSEEAVTDPTDFCLARKGAYQPSRITVDFWNIVPSAHTTWNMSPEMLAYLNSPVTPVVNNTGTDPVKPTNFTGNLGDAPWSKAYKCANQDYQVILAPENFFSLDSPYELDFKEVGNRKSDRFYVINLHRLLVFEPFNFYANMDMGRDRYRYLPYRICKIWSCPPVAPNKRKNIIGMQATIDTSVIRTNETLYHMATPRLLLFAEKAWREGRFENILQPNNATTLTNMSLVAYRSQALDMEITAFLNNYAYKESGRLDSYNYPYRVTRPGVSIYFGIPFRTLGDYPAVVKVDVPDVTVQYRNRAGADRTWRQMFYKNRETGQVFGGYNLTFPLVATQDIDIRVLSTDGQRSSIPTRLTGNTDYLWPREVPVDLRANTCNMSILEPWTTKLEDVTTAQWNQIISNVGTVTQEEMQFLQNRAAVLEATFTAHSRQYRLPAALTIANVFQQIEQYMMNGVDPSTLPDSDVHKVIYTKEQEIMQAREAALQQRMMAMHQAYLTCSGQGAAATTQAAPPRT